MNAKVDISMKRSIRFCAIALIALLCISAVSVALACSGYSNRTYWANESKVYGRIDACSCTPRNNHLYASTRAQFENSSGELEWTNWTESYGDNVAYKSSTTSPNGPVSKGTVHFRHECVTGGSDYVYYDLTVTP